MAAKTQATPAELRKLCRDITKAQAHLLALSTRRSRVAQALVDEGWSWSEVAEECEVSKAAVGKWLTKGASRPT